MPSRHVVPTFTLLFSTLGAASTAHAGPVTWEFAGDVTEIIDPHNVLGQQVVIGSLLQGSFTFESTTPDTYPHPSGGRYNNAITNAHATIASLPIDGPTTPEDFVPNYILADVGDIDLPDLYGVSIPVYFLGHDFFALSFSLIGPHGTILDDDAILLSPPPLGALETHFFINDPTESFAIALKGRLETLVPEPSTLALLYLAGIILCRTGRMQDDVVDDE
jgi:hypothetical protein